MIQLRNKLEQEKGKKESLLSLYSDKNEELKNINRDIRYLEQAVPIAQIVAQQTQQELKYHISELVTLALSAVFDDPYEFEIIFESKRGKTEARIVFLKNGEEIDPMTSSGGGAIVVAAFALRVALWNLQRPRSRNTLVLDEALKFLSLDLHAKAGKMLRMLSEKLEIQIILVTHSEAISEFAHKSYEIYQEGGISYAR